jgi:hypothetical protein
MAWLLDTNVLVNAKRAYYGFAFCPAFWDWRRNRRHTPSVESEA